MTCKDCIHEKPCFEYGNMLDPFGGGVICDSFQSKADVVEVKHSEWKLYDDGSGVCKNCNTHQRDVWDMDNVQRFCCRCGAKMDGGKVE